MDRFPHYQQRDEHDCGPACVRIISAYYEHPLPIETLRDAVGTTREGSDLKGISDAAEKLGFRSLAVRADLRTLREEVPLPCILHWEEDHFLVLYRIGKRSFKVSDPAQGKMSYPIPEFLEKWTGTKDEEQASGILLLLEPTPLLYREEKAQKEGRKGFAFLGSYLFRYKGALFQVAAGLLATSLLQLIFPFLTQSIVDIGVRNEDLRFVYLLLLGQLMVFIGRTIIELIRGWILLHLSTRINVALIADFFIKLMRLPIAFFDSRVTGDLMQRIEDHRRIERFLTNSSLNVLFSMLSLIVFGGVLAWYSEWLFLIFLIGTLVYLAWVFLFMEARRKLDHRRFSTLSQEQSKVMEMIQGMQEIKLNNAEKEKRWDWERLQAQLYRIDIRTLALEQKQRAGSGFINELKNILITTFSARAVIHGDMTLGMMLSVSYIIGQLNGPVDQLVGFFHTAQDARIALERTAEVHDREDESPHPEATRKRIPSRAPIRFEAVSFAYPGSEEAVLKDIDLEMEERTTTAIVGSSGSGKTTLLKLLLRFHAPTKGRILLGRKPFESFEPSAWRRNCGVVMQEGRLFDDRLDRNIAIGEERIDEKRFERALELAQIGDLVEELPRGVNTRLGKEGLELSTGQKQRVLIARAIYKDPSYLFFDEATSSLDAATERAVMNGLRTFMAERSSLVIAHRLSTVKNADRIVVLEKGRVVEQGDHRSLIEERGSYYHLVREQLELERTAPSDA